MEVGGRLGGGAYGEVFSGALVARLPVALKRTHDVLAELYVSQVAHEAAVARALCHPNVVRTHGAVAVPGRPVEIVMDRAPCTLEGLLRHAGSALSFRERIELCIGVVRGVAYLHSRELVHADLRTLNVLVARSMRPMIADMGLTRHLTSVGPDIGSPVSGPYCAPERRNVPRGANPLHNRVAWDVFSCGVLCMEVLTGRGCVDWATAAQLDAAWSAEMRTLAAPVFAGVRGAIDATHAVDPAVRPPLGALLAALQSARSGPAYAACGAVRGISVAAAADGAVTLD
jgi:serine/threonine protein kinase